MSDQARHSPTKATSPASSGPAGARLEGQIGAQYLLSLLGAGAPRGLPGVATVSRVAFQGASSGFPMDDVIVTGHLHGGSPATLELQAKRTLDFTAGDKTFADVVRRAVEAARKPEFRSHFYVVAAGVGRTSTRIEQYVQWVLKWARDKQDHATFFEHLQRPGFGSQPARDFVKAFQGHMQACGGPSNEESAWQLLRRFLVLPFDFEAPGSQAEQVVLDRCSAALAPQDSGRAAEFWDTLVDHALSLDSTGGCATPESLKDHLAERSYKLAGERRWRNARKSLAEDTEAALADIQRDVAGLCLPRQHLIDAAQAALASAGYLEIRGSGGVGKSALLATLAEFRAPECHVMLLAPGRVPAGGWGAMRARLLLDDASAREFLADLAGDGGGLLCIDGIDRFVKEDERNTVKDLMRAAAATPGFKVVATARDDFADQEARAWIPRDVLTTLKVASMEPVGELRDEEAEALATYDKTLAALLSSWHPARALVRNLHRLDRLATWARAETTDGTGSRGGLPVSEAQMAWQWWHTGDGADESLRRLSTRLLHDLAEQALDPLAGPLNCRSRPHDAIGQLVKSRSLHDQGNERIDFAHDVLRDWAIGCLLVTDHEQLVKLPRSGPAPASLARGVEIAARLLVEGVHLPADAAADAPGNAFSWFLAAVTEGAHGSWRRSALLALARSERAEQTLTACSAMLMAENGRLLQELVSYVRVVDSRRGADALDGAAVSGSARDRLAVAVPTGPSWLGLVAWSLNHPELIPDAAVPSVVELYHAGAQHVVAHAHDGASTAGRMLAQMHEWLLRAEGPPAKRNDPNEAHELVPRRPVLNLSAQDERMLRTACMTWAAYDRPHTRAYLRRIASSHRRDDVCRELLDRIDDLPQAVPKDLVDFLLATWCGPEIAPTAEGPFAFWDTVFYPASPSRRPFLELLRAAPEQGLRLVRAVVARALRQLRAGDRNRRPAADVPLNIGPRQYAAAGSYGWARGHAGALVGSALMALEAWGHERIEAGTAVDAVVADVMGPDGSCAAFALVAVDLVLSHLPRSLEMAAYFAGSAQLLSLDYQRREGDFVRQQEVIDAALGMSVLRPELPELASRASLLQRPSRKSSLDKVLFTIGFSGPEGLREAVRERLQADLSRLSRSPADAVAIGARALVNPRIAAMVGLSRLDPDRYSAVTPSGDAEGQAFRYLSSDIERHMLEATMEAQHASSGDLHTRLIEAVQRRPVDGALLTAALAWADQTEGRPSVQGLAGDASTDEALCAKHRSRTIAAALVLRDAPDELHRQRGDWALWQLRVAAGRQAPRRGAIRAVPYNEAALAAIGFLACLRRNSLPHLEQPDIVKDLLELAARLDAGLTAVIRSELSAGWRIDPSLGRAMCRLGLASATFERPGAEEFEQVVVDDPLMARARHAARERQREERDQARAGLAVAAELRWLRGEGSEPEWPDLPHPWRLLGVIPSAEVVMEHPMLAPAAAKDHDHHVDTDVAAAWLAMAGELAMLDEPGRILQLLDRYWPWTAAANGVKAVFEGHPLPLELRLEWNRAYFQVAAKSGPSQVWRATQLWDDGFFMAAAAMLQTVDDLWLRRGLATIDDARALRLDVCARFAAAGEWRNLRHWAAGGHGWPFADCIAAIFFCDRPPGQGPQCVLKPHEVVQTRALLPMLAELAESGAQSPVVAAAFLSLIAMVPDRLLLPLVAKVHTAWCRAHGANRDFWSGQRFALRLSNWVKSVAEHSDAVTLSTDRDLVGMLDALVRVGSDGALELERLLGIQPDRKRP